jgi:hypothetical protein
MSGLSNKTLSIFQNLQVSLEYLRNTLYEREASLLAVYTTMNTLLIYQNIMYRALDRDRYDGVMGLVNDAISAYCCFFETPINNEDDRQMILDSVDVDPFVSYFDNAIDLMRSIQENKG